MQLVCPTAFSMFFSCWKTALVAMVKVFPWDIVTFLLGYILAVGVFYSIAILVWHIFALCISFNLCSELLNFSTFCIVIVLTCGWVVHPNFSSGFRFFPMLIASSFFFCATFIFSICYLFWPVVLIAFFFSFSSAFISPTVFTFLFSPVPAFLSIFSFTLPVHVWFAFSPLLCGAFISKIK